MKKYKLIKLLGFSAITTIPLIAASCNKGTSATDQEKIIGENLVNQISRWEDVSQGGKQFDFLNNVATKVSFYQPNTKTAYTKATAGIFIDKYAKKIDTPTTTTYTLTSGTLQTMFSPFATLDVTTGTGDKAKTFTQNVVISFEIVYNKISGTGTVSKATYSFDPQTNFITIFQNRLENLLKDKTQTSVTNKDDLQTLKNFMKKGNYQGIYDQLWNPATPKNAVIEKSKDNTTVNTKTNTATFAKNEQLPNADKKLNEGYQVTFTVNFSKESGRLIEVPAAITIAQIK